MICPSNALPSVYLCRVPVDFHKDIHGLAMLVEHDLGRDPFSESLYVFTNRRRDAVKCLYWEHNGFYLWHKKLEQERFKWPMDRDSAVFTLSGQQLNWLLDVRRLQPLGWSARTGLRKGIK